MWAENQNKDQTTITTKMAEKRSVKRRKKGDSDELENPTKDEKAVAQYLRFNLETKKANLYGNEAFYFYGDKAVDYLLDSKWAKSSKSSLSFTHRESVVSFMNRLIAYGIISHVEVIKIEKRIKDKKKEENKKGEKKETHEEKEKKNGNSSAPGTPRAKKDAKETKKVKKKVKTTLEYHDVQVFYDNENEFFHRRGNTNMAYVWTYDPLSWTTLILGVLLVLGVILVCLFPLWPENIREYSWYLSVAGAIFVGAILVLAVFRYILYGILWLCTFGKLHFWLLPNLTAECGFFESFVPFYEYEVTEKNKSENSEKKKTKSKDKKDNSESKDSPKEEIIEKVSDSEKVVDDDDDDAENKKNESEESSGSTKEDEWVKVRKPEEQTMADS